MNVKQFILVIALALSVFSAASADPTHNTIDLDSQHKTSAGVVCARGNHKDNDVCVSNTDWCEEGAMDFSTGDCYDCKLYAWTTTSETQGRYCATHWWRWLLWILLALVILAIIGAVIAMMRKKNLAKANRSYGDMNTHNSL